MISSKKNSLFFLLFSLFIQIGSAQQLQKLQLHGKITDASSDMELMKAFILVKELKLTTLADSLGDYSFAIPSGKYTLRVSYVGYDTKEVKVDLEQSSRVDIRLLSNNSLDEVLVTARSKDENISRLQMGVERMNIKDIKKMPALMGEVDIIKAIQLLPGVQATSEGSSGFSVRGGSPDQNLILLDNTTVYNPSHFFGFFSVFNNDVISGLDLYKGDLPLKYGGRLSSLLDVRTVNEMPEKFSGTGGIGLISSRIMMQGLAGEKTSWLVGGRRSYADLFLKLSSDEALKKSQVYFYDLNAKVSHVFSEKDKLELNAYYGKDVFGSQPGSFNYGNIATSLTWSHVFSENLFSKFSVNLSNYDYGLASKLEGSEATWRSSILDLSLRADFTQLLGESSKLTYGFSSTVHRFNPATVNISDYQGYKVPGSQALETGIYVANEQKITDKMSIRYGLRSSVFQNFGKATIYRYDDKYESLDSVRYGSGDFYNTYYALEPRIGLVYKLNSQSSVKANYAHNTQFIQLANNSASGSPLDVWFAASPNVKPQQVDLFSMGYFLNLKENLFEMSVEFYYKDLDNVIDFADHAQLLLNEKLEGEIRTGTGKAYGAEFMVRKNTGKLTGFINYTLSRSERTIPEINEGKTYLAPYDKTHSFNVVLNYEFSKKWNASATWIFATGNPTTYPTGRFEIGGEYFPIYSGRNEYRRPNYDRLDLSVTYIPNPGSKKRWSGEWNFSLYNAYNRKNPWMITYNQDNDSGIPYAEMIYLFGVVPSVTYNFRF